MSENEPVIKVSHIVKDYGKGRGNFDIDFQMMEGEALGIVGENGAGKTTLLRQMMGFIKPDSGSIRLKGYDAYRDSAKTKTLTGYIPGEINFPDVKTGNLFLKNYGASMGMKPEDFAYADQIISRMQLDIRAYPKRMSKGMKQKTAIVAALMLKKPIILMDEPSIGLDPLMRDELLTLINEQKQHKATMVITSNTIEELERTCDKVAYMTAGKIVDVADVQAVRNRPWRDYNIGFASEEDYLSFLTGRQDIYSAKPEKLEVHLRTEKTQIPSLLENLSQYDICFISEKKYSLTDYFDERRREKKEEANNVNK